MRRDGGSVFRARANTGDPNGLIEACPIMRTHPRADIHDGPEHRCSNQRPDTLMQDRSPPIRRNLLATHGRTIHRGHSRRFAHIRTCPIRVRSRKDEIKRYRMVSPLRLLPIGWTLGRSSRRSSRRHPHYRRPDTSARRRSRQSPLKGANLCICQRESAHETAGFP